MFFLPENNLFGSPNGSDSLESKENDRPVKSKVQAAREQASLRSGLFEDNEDDDDFFSGKTLKKPMFGELVKACAGLSHHSLVEGLLLIKTVDAVVKIISSV